MGYITNFLDFRPMEKRHALVVKEKAHQADIDAKVTYEKFLEQFNKLKSLFSGKPIPHIEQLINLLFENISFLKNIDNREYPQYQSEHNEKELFDFRK